MIAYIREILYGLKGRNRYKHYKELLVMQRLPQEELRQRQFWLLSTLLAHAYNTVPFYKKRLDALGLHPDDIRSFEDFAQLPVISRQDTQENLTEMISGAVLENMRYLNFSGGTTGEPIRFYQDLRLRESMEASWLLCLSFAGWKPSDMIVSIWGNPRDSTSSAVKQGLRPWLAGQLVVNAYRYGKEEFKAWLAAITSYRRVYLYGYASVIADLAEYMLDANRKAPSVQGVLTTAERLHESQRETIARAFNCRVYDQYGSREVPAVSMECGAGNMHLLTHSAYAEFLPLTETTRAHVLNSGGDGDDEPRRIVLTSLTNRAMPLIRYEVGDYGMPMDGACPCGRGFPLMRMSIGRLGGSLVTPDGKRLYSTFFVRQMYGMEGVSAFQFRQKSLVDVQLHVVRGLRFHDGTARKLAELQERFGRDLCPGMRLNVRYVEDVPRTPGGKHRHVVCEVES